MIEIWVFLLGIFATALICFVGGFALGLYELQKDIEEKAVTIKHGGRVFVCIDYILEIIDNNEKCVTDMNNDLDEGYYTACNHIKVAVKAMEEEKMCWATHKVKYQRV